jgi:hypothetical protein
VGSKVLSLMVVSDAFDPFTAAIVRIFVCTAREK